MKLEMGSCNLFWMVNFDDEFCLLTYLYGNFAVIFFVGNVTGSVQRFATYCFHIYKWNIFKKSQLVITLV